VTGTLLGSANAASRELLADRLQNQTSLLILEKAASLEVERFENPETYDALRNAYGEVGSRPLGVVVHIVAIAQALITLAAIGGLMARLGGGVMPLVIAASLPGVVVSSRLGAATYRMLRRRAPDARFQNYLGSLLTSDAIVKEVRVFAFERYLLDGWQRYYRAFRAEFVRLLYRRSAWSVAASLASAVLIALATLSVLRRAAQGTITVGDFSLFVLGIGQVQSQFSGLLANVSSVHESLLYMRNLFEFLELPSRDLNAGEEWRGPIECVEFDRVSFRYPLTDREVVSDVSFRVRRGQALALIGENGAGKTTIVKLLTRLFEPTGGRILLNGMEATRFSIRSVQREMTIILQDFGQFQMTARENIALSRTDAVGDETAVEAAAVKSGADEFVRALPDAYETMLGRLFPRGRQLSGGQWQRLALARLYFRPASVQIFDEPTAALDARAEAAILERLQATRGERISLLVSHRFAGVRLADQILVMHGGSIVEAGSHGELVSSGGLYSKLFEMQARAYRDP
jgi:ATP-binding cassette, subfamily B, bacterial